MTLVGKSVPRLDGKVKVTGKALYTAHLELPGMLVGKLLRSPLPHAEIVRLDTSRARSLKGVVTVLTADDFAELNIQPRFGSIIPDQPVLAMGKVRYIGEPIAAVAALTEEAAEEALELIDCELRELPAVLSPLDAIRPGSPPIHSPRQGSESPHEYPNLASSFQVIRGEIEQGFAEADVVLEGEFQTPAVQHGHLEPHVVLASVDTERHIDVWSSTQTPWNVRSELARVFQVPLAHVRVRVPFVGGGYGGKCYAHLEPVTAVLAAKAGRPVKLSLKLDESFLTLTKHAAHVWVKSGIRRDGRLTARQIKIYWDTGAYADVGPRVAMKGAYQGLGPYFIPHVHVDSLCIYTNQTPAGAYRGFGCAQVCWAVEQQMDELAEKLGMAPDRLRAINAIEEGQSFHTGEKMIHVPVREILETAVDRIAKQPRMIEVSSEWRVGRGMACSVKGTNTPSQSVASLRLDGDGSLSVLVSTVEIGQGANTALSQIAADALELPIEKVRLVAPDTDATPFDPSTSGSRSVYMMGNAILMAAAEIKHELMRAASKILEIDVQDLELRSERVSAKGNPSTAIGFQEIMQQMFSSRGGSLLGRGVYKTEGGLDRRGQGKASVFWEVAASACELKVNVQTGSIEIERFVLVTDVGRAINPALCQGQIEGAIVMGVGHALFEQVLRDPSGQPLNPSFLDYPLPTCNELPKNLEVVLIEHPHPEGPFGAHGVGESAMPSIAPCIANAVYDAVGVRIRELPITPEKVLWELKKQQAERPAAVRHV